MALHKGHQAVPALQEIKSQIHWPLHHHPPSQPSILLAPVTHYCIHSTLHVSLLKPYHSPVSDYPTEPCPIDKALLLMILDNGPVYAVQ